MTFEVYTFDWYTVVLIIAFVLVTLLTGHTRWQHRQNLDHVYLVGLGLRPLDDRCRKLTRQKVYQKEFERGQTKYRLRQNIHQDLYGKPKKVIQTDVFGIPIRRTQ